MSEPKPVQASIVIATYNRAAYLLMCLEALATLKADMATFETIIIDNNSNDNTREVILKFAELNPSMNVCYIHESNQGASRARNRGIAKAQGKIIYFLDDDAVPYPDWLTQMTAGFTDPTVGCVGGPAILDFQGSDIPPWYSGDLKGLLSGYSLGYTEPTVINSVSQFPFLCNMAIRRTVLDKVGLLRTDLGPSANNLVVGEETELMGRIRQAGWSILYLPDAKVRHLVAPERLEKQYMYRSALRLAVTHIFVTWENRIDKILRWFASDLWYATRMLFWFVIAILRRKPLWFDDYMRFWMVAKRIPLRLEALLWGRQSIEFPKARSLTKG